MQEEEPLQALDRRITRVETKQESMEPAIEKLSTNVEALNATINRGRGAVWLIGGVGAALMELAHWAADAFKGHQ